MTTQLKDIHAKRGNAIKECAWYYIRVRRVSNVLALDVCSR